MEEKRKIEIALIDDHTLFRKGLANLIEMIGNNFTIVFEADNGTDLQNKLNVNNIPHIILMDINMPEMDGFESVQWLSQHYPDIKVIVLSMIENEESIVRMLKLGVKGYLCKDVEPNELEQALIQVFNSGFYYSDVVTGKMAEVIKAGGVAKNSESVTLNDREKEFLTYACSEMTYQEIADRMFLSPKTVDGYRNALFEKLKVKNRVGMVLYAIKNKLVQLGNL